MELDQSPLGSSLDRLHRKIRGTHQPDVKQNWNLIRSKTDLPGDLS